MQMAGEDWSDLENSLIVADYFSMLAAEIAGQAYVKAEHNRNLQPLLNDRTRGSVEKKHQNISAVMVGLGQPWINGYKPLPSFQGSLVDAVMHWLDANPCWLRPATADEKSGGHDAVREVPSLWIGPAPTFSNEPPTINSEFMAKVARKFDVAERDARNRDLGKAGEELVLRHERARLCSERREDLAGKVRWTAVQDGDGAGYDILSFESDGRKRLIEVKTTNGWERTPFHVTRNELIVADANRDHWHLVRLWNFAREPKAYSIRPPLNAHIALTPTSFLASLH